MRSDGDPADGVVRPRSRGGRLAQSPPRAGLARRPGTARVAALGLLVGALLLGCGSNSPGGNDDTSSSPAEASTRIASPAPELPSSVETPLLNDQPDPNSTVGGLAPGFPSDLLPVPGGVEVLVSSVDPIGDSTAYQVSLNLRTVLLAPEIVDIYRQSLTGAGFTEAEQTTPDAALAAQSTFTRSGGDEVLVIGVLDRDGVRTVTIGGRLRDA